MPYVNPDILEEDWDALGDWADEDINGGVSSIDPAGQLYLDCRALTSAGYARRAKDFGTIGSGDYYVEVKIKGDVWDKQSDATPGFQLFWSAGTYGILMYLGNNADFGGGVSGDGIFLYTGTAYVKVVTKTWDTNWHTIIFFIHNGQSDCDIWVDNDPSEEADAIDAVVQFEPAQADGTVSVQGNGSTAGDGEYHEDYIYIGTNWSPTITIDVSSSMSLSEAESALRSRTTSVSDSMSLSGTISALRTRITSVTDTIALTDKILQFWRILAKHTATWAHQSKSEADPTYTKESKSTSIWSFLTKNR